MRIGDILLEYDGETSFEKEIGQIYKNKSSHDYFHCGLYIGCGEVVETDKEKGVIISSLDEWLQEKKFHVYEVLGIEKIQNKIREFFTKLLGEPYNKYFMEEKDGFYCSELVQHIINSLMKEEIIKSLPMSFGDSPEIASDYWTEYYKELGEKVPLKKLGTHPKNIILNNKIKFKS
ncbi:MAG: YiiX/YebB-like N1pC/P60 family cysteine hydrolase [Fusobacteriaceae bacterium]